MLTRIAYWTVAWIGRPIGGVRPRRLGAWLGRSAFQQPPTDSEFVWVSNRWGHRLLLHPYFLIDSQIIANGTYEERTHMFLDRHLNPNDVCLDIGANLGEMALHMGAIVTRTGAVFAFEPAPRNYARLAQHISENSMDRIITPLQIALSDRDGEVELNVNMGGNRNHGDNTIVDDLPRAALRVPVISRSLDSLAATLPISRMDFVKVDIQGAEPQFVAGAMGVLSTLKPDLLVEIEPERLPVPPGEFLSRLSRLGYAFYEISRKGTPGRRVPSDVGAAYRCSALYCSSRGPRLSAR